MSLSSHDASRDRPGEGRSDASGTEPGRSGRAEPLGRVSTAPTSGEGTSDATGIPILILEGDEDRARYVSAILEFLGYPVVVASPQDWLERAGRVGNGAAAALIGCDAGEQALLDLVDAVRAWDATLPICVLDLDGTARALVEGSREVGRFVRALDYPLRQPQLITALEQGRQFQENRKPRSASGSLRLSRALVGASPVMQQVRYLINKVAPTDATVLVLGETGTGKEIVARNIHYLSARRGAPFVAVNCGAIPAELLESELFGHEKGAFTGAITSRPGRFELAEGGTLFLDEIGDMPLPMQVKLLRVLQEQTYERVGGTRSLRTNVRVIAATHRDMERVIEEGQFREDLYYRLNVFPIETPPLRARIEDLPLLINELIARMEAAGRGTLSLSASAVDALSRYAWPGNVRELANLVERLAILHPGELVTPSRLPRKFLPQGYQEPERETADANEAARQDAIAGSATLRLPPGGLDLRDYLSRQEITLINQALDEANGVVAQAAGLLGMRRTTLVEKMRKYGMNRKDATAEF